MPVLLAKASHEYWKQFPDPIIYRVLCYMESVEVSKDENALLKMVLEELGKTLDQVENVDFNKLAQRDVFITLANHLNMVQTLRFLQALDSAQPGSAAQLLVHAETITQASTDEAGIFLQRNLIFERLRLLSRVFSEERLTLIHTALEELN